MARPGEAADLGPGGPAALVTRRRTELGAADPGSVDMFREPHLDEGEVGAEVGGQDEKATAQPVPVPEVSLPSTPSFCLCG